MVTGYFRKVREFFSRNYHQQVRVDGERAMDNLMGTMIGVLFLSIISASFAGIFMAYTVSTAKATENTDRNNVVVKHSTDTLNNLYIDSINGKTSATAAGWTVLSHQKALSAASPALNPAPNAAFAGFTFAATRPMTAGGTTLVSQWGTLGTDTTSTEHGLVTIYTAIPKAGSPEKKENPAFKCDWTMPKDKLETLCIVAIDKIQSVVSPPVGVKDEKKVRWAEEINQYPWIAAAQDWTSDIRRDVTTTKLGEIKTNGVRNFKYVVMFDDLTPGKEVQIDFVESTAGKPNTIYSHTFTPTLEAGETGKVTRSNQGVITLPAGVDTLTAYIDTDVAQPTNASDQTVKMYRFIVYTKK